MDTSNVVKLAIDAIRNKVPTEFSTGDTSEVLRKAFIEANGGSDKIDYKTFRKHPELYDIIEQIIPVMIEEGLAGDEFFMNYVDTRNLALGDEIDFLAEDRSTFIVADAAQGTQAIRRQRLNVGDKVTVTPALKLIKIYEELNRLLAGRVDFNKFVDKVGSSMLAKVYGDIYTAFNGISSSTAGMTTDYYKTGSFSEDTLLTLIDHVEAATGKFATITGARSALRKITTAVVSDKAKDDMYNIGFYGKFNSTPMVVAKQRHAAGTDTFILDDSKVYVIAGDEKFIKNVNGGTGFLEDGNPMDRPDMTKEYFYGQMFGSGILIASRLGVYDIG